jgi:polar amino acid transport system substrate-binding protein
MGGTTLRSACRALALAGAVMAGLAGVAQADPIKVGYVEFPPYSYTDNGKPAGSLIETLRKVAADQGIEYTIESVPARRLMAGLPQGELDLFLGVKTAKEFEGTTLASANPIDTVEMNAYALNEAPAVKVKEDLSGKAVIALTGFSLGGWRAWMEDPANKVTLVDARTTEQALALLEAGRAPVFIQWSKPVQTALDAKPMPALKTTSISSTPVYFVLSKKTPNAEAVMGKLEAGYQKLKAAGALK